MNTCIDRMHVHPYEKMHVQLRVAIDGNRSQLSCCMHQISGCVGKITDMQQLAS